VLSKLLRWYHRNSFNKKYILQLEADYCKLQELYANCTAEGVEFSNYKAVENIKKLIKENTKFEQDCEITFENYSIKRITRERGTTHFQVFIESKNDKQKFRFHGRKDYWLCDSNENYVDLSHHKNNKVYMQSLNHINEIFI